MSNAQLKVKNVPVFYFPWIKFPVNDRRSSGLLFPTVHNNSSNGFDYAQPIYWNLAANYDATITPRLIQERGLGVELELRHLSRFSNTEISGAFLGDDKGGKSNRDIDPVTGLPEHRGRSLPDGADPSRRYWQGTGQPIWISTGCPITITWWILAICLRRQPA